MQTIIAAILSIIFLLISLLHFYWGVGGKWGSEKAIPTKVTGEKLFQPSVPECFVVALALLGVVWFILMYVEVLPEVLPARLLNAGIWCFSAIFIVRAVGDFKYTGFFKSVTTTTFGRNDTKYYSPLCLLIGILTLTLALVK